MIFESGAILFHLGELSDKLMPVERRGRSEVKEWLFAGFASVEAASQPSSFFKFSGDAGETPMSIFLTISWTKKRDSAHGTGSGTT